MNTQAHDSHGFGELTAMDMDGFDNLAEHQAQLPAVQNQPYDMQPMVKAGMSYVTATIVQKPRNLNEILANLSLFAAKFGEDYYYSWSAKGKEISGPTIKLANDLFMLFGNSAIECDVIDTKTHWIFKATFVDLERGVQLTRLFQQRKNQTLSDKMDADRQADIAFQIGQSKAIRNVIVNALRSFADYAVHEARSHLVGKIQKNMDGYRERIVARFKQEKIDIEVACHMVGRSVNKWTASDMAGIASRIIAVDEGMANFDEQFPDNRDDEVPDDLEAGHVEKSAKPKKKKKDKSKKPAEAKLPPPIKGSPEKPEEGKETPAESKPEDAPATAGTTGPVEMPDLPDSLKPTKKPEPQTNVEEKFDLAPEEPEMENGGETDRVASEEFLAFVIGELEGCKTVEQLQDADSIYHAEVEGHGPEIIAKYVEAIKQLKAEIEVDARQASLEN
ncbi:MAG: hypothetical protein GY952_13950 [Rhodobacteraceae bacterium]|nr:hypothetical protein [Paracoccaceae bacterium]